tara:strand:- start:2783 stop:4246 length:1464 start_codon:yes stop_codon:yes gene_type:complete
MIKLPTLLIVFALTALQAHAQVATPTAPASARDGMQQLLEQRKSILRKLNTGEDVTLDRRRFLEAINLYNERHPKEPSGLKMAAQVGTALNDDEAVDANYAALLAIEPNDLRAILNWSAYHALTNVERSEQILLDAIRNDPGNRLLRISLVELYAKMMPNRIQAEFDSIVAMPPGMELQTFLSGLGSVDMDQSVSYARLAHAAWPEDQMAIQLLASRLRWTTEFEEALEYYAQLDEELLLQDDVSIDYSDCLYAVHRFTDSIGHLQKTLDNLESSDRKAGMMINFRLGVRPEIIDLWKAEKVLREQDRARDDNPIAVITIEGRPVTVELFENEAPIAVANFIALAGDGFYANSPFHRIQTGLMSQTGIAAGDADPYGGPGYTITNESGSPVARNHFRGSIAMAKTSPEQTIGSQFYITHFPTMHLNATGPVFGRTLEGLDVIEDMRGGETIDSIVITRRRDHDYDFDVTTKSGVVMPHKVWKTIPAE